jgi:radical SAM protein with 4Fe4S-binding SPASM domain
MKKSKNFVPKHQNLPKNFCVLPWHHIYVDPAGECKPCCLINTNKSWGNLNENSLETIWNNQHFAKFRKQFLNGEISSDLCKVCVENEEGKIESERQRYIQDLSFDIESIVNETSPAGTFPKIDLKLLDFRPSNLCNFKCRTCGPIYSSAWAQEKQDFLAIKLTSPFKIEDSQIRNLEEIYFAGGEPLLMREHYEILEKLISMGKTDTRLRYNSNASVLGVSNKSVIELWKQFDNVFFGCSLDETGERAEYLRKGCSWPKTVENILKIRTETPHVRITPNLTVSIFNILRLPEILDEFLQSGILQPTNPFDFTFNIVRSPEHFSPFILPIQYQEREKNRISEFFAQWKKNFPSSSFFLYDAFLAQLGKIEVPRSEMFLRKVEEVDHIRNENFALLFPELKGILEGKSE